MDNTFVKTVLWKEIFFLFLIAYVLGFFLRTKFFKKLKKAEEQFFSGQWDGLYRVCKNLRESPLVSINAIWNPHYKNIQSALCAMCASIAYCEGNIALFLSDLQYAKPDLHTGQKEILLALYFQSIGEYSQAVVFYNAYQQVSHKDSSAETVFQYIFSEQKESFDLEHVRYVIRNIQNPALRKLIAANGVLVD